MNNLLKTLVMLMMIIAIGTVKTFAGETKVIAIKTSIICDMCESNVKKRLELEKGVQKIEVNLDTKIITVTYNPAKTDPLKIKKCISKAGYDADEVVADPKAYKKLDACCKKDGIREK